jgi:hypothetical protein
MRWGLDHLDVRGGEHGVENGRELRVAFAEQEPQDCPPARHHAVQFAEPSATLPMPRPEHPGGGRVQGRWGPRRGLAGRLALEQLTTGEVTTLVVAQGYAMFSDYWKYDWVLDIVPYRTVAALVRSFDRLIVQPAEETAEALANRRGHTHRKLRTPPSRRPSG